MAGYGLRRIGRLSTDPLPSKTRTFSELVLPILAGCYLIFLEGFFLEQAQRDRFQNEKDYAVVSRGQPKKKKKKAWPSTTRTWITRGSAKGDRRACILNQLN